MPETSTERTARLAEEKAARKASQKNMTVRQAALAMLHNRIKDFEISQMDLAVFMRKPRATAGQAEKANAAIKKSAAKFLERLAKAAGAKNVK